MNDAPSLYIHIPFCARKCGYCDFYSEPAARGDVDRYLKALDVELRGRFRKPMRPATVFVGGGTPTILNTGQLKAFGEVLHRRLDLSGSPEFTCEINPSTFSAEKAAALAAFGVNRASFGVQSFDRDLLAALDRANEAGAAQAAIEAARNAGIERRSMDLIFAAPGQTLAQLEADIATALSHEIEHLSLYALTFEDDTPLSRLLAQGEIEPCPEPLEREMFAAAGRICAAAGLPRYEVSNFARPGAECGHNLRYWRCEDWIGVGAGAHSWVGGEVSANAADWRAYCDSLLARGVPPVARQEQLSPMEQAETLLMMGLRLTQGFSLARFRKLCGEEFKDVCGAVAAGLESRGLLTLADENVSATPEGLLVLDTLVLELASALEAAA